MKTPRADKFQIVRASESLRKLAERKDPTEIIELSDFSLAPDDRDDVDVFQEGVRIGLLMAAQGKRIAVDLNIHSDDDALGLCFVGTPAEVRKKIAALEDVEDEEPK